MPTGSRLPLSVLSHTAQYFNRRQASSQRSVTVCDKSWRGVWECGCVSVHRGQVERKRRMSVAHKVSMSAGEVECCVTSLMVPAVDKFFVLFEEEHLRVCVCTQRQVEEFSTRSTPSFERHTIQGTLRLRLMHVHVLECMQPWAGGVKLCILIYVVIYIFHCLTSGCHHFWILRMQSAIS